MQMHKYMCMHTVYTQNIHQYVVLMFLIFIPCRGSFLTVQKGNISTTTWMDRKEVAVMYSNCQQTSIDTVTRRQRMNWWVVLTEEIRQEDTIHVGQKQKIPQIHLFFSLLGVTITNVYVLHKIAHGNKYDIKEFRLHLARELIGDYCTCRRPGHGGGIYRALPLRHFPTTITSETQTKKKEGAVNAASKGTNKRTRSGTGTSVKCGYVTLDSRMIAFYTITKTY